MSPIHIFATPSKCRFFLCFFHFILCLVCLRGSQFLWSICQFRILLVLFSVILCEIHCELGILTTMPTASSVIACDCRLLFFVPRSVHTMSLDGALCFYISDDFVGIDIWWRASKRTARESVLCSVTFLCA